MSHVNPSLDILETTLRDGSYVVDFQFTASDTAWMARALERSGVRWIEIGHGLGLGASRAVNPAAASDVEYILAAKGVLAEAKVGMFCIPGIATLDDLERAVDAGMDFVRIGTDVDRVPTMRTFVERARALNIRVCTNFMKSYTLSPADFVGIARQAADFGSQMNYLVDSAGGMLPHEVREYLEGLAGKTSIPFGFHGHDNLRLATANTLLAIELGALWVDTTLFGVGRGSGNASTELITGICQRRHGLLSHLALDRLVDLADRQALPLTFHRRQELLSMSLGLAQVHSIFLDRIVARARTEGIGEHVLIDHVGRINKINLDEGVLASAVDSARSDPRTGTDFDVPGGFFAITAGGDVRELVARAENVAWKLAVPCVVYVTGDDAESRVELEAGMNGVRAIIGGDPREAAAAVRSSNTRIVFAPGLAAIAREVDRAGTGQKTTVAREWPPRGL